MSGNAIVVENLSNSYLLVTEARTYNPARVRPSIPSEPREIQLVVRLSVTEGPGAARNADSHHHTSIQRLDFAFGAH